MHPDAEVSDAAFFRPIQTGCTQKGDRLSPHFETRNHYNGISYQV